MNRRQTLDLESENEVSADAYTAVGTEAEPDEATGAYDDAELIRRYREGDPMAAATLFYLHHPDAVRYGRFLTRDRGRGEDLASEAFTKVLEVIRNGSGPTARFRPYLRTVLKNCATSAARADEPLITLADFDEDIGEFQVEPQIDARFDAAEAVAAFKTLPDRWQQVLYLRLIDESSVPHMAARFSLTTRAMSGLLFRARLGLRKAYCEQLAMQAAAPECVPQRHLMVRAATGKLSETKRFELSAHCEGCTSCTEARTRVEDTAKQFETNETAVAAIVLAAAAVVPFRSEFFSSPSGAAALARSAVQQFIAAAPLVSVTIASVGLVVVGALSLALIGGMGGVWAAHGGSDGAKTADGGADDDRGGSDRDHGNAHASDCDLTAEASPGAGGVMVTVENHSESSCAVQIVSETGEVLVESTVDGVQQFMLARIAQPQVRALTEHGIRVVPLGAEK